MYIFRYYTSIPVTQVGRSIESYTLETRWMKKSYAVTKYYITYFPNVFALAVL